MFMCSYFGQQCCVKDVNSISYFEIEGSYSSEGASRTHARTSPRAPASLLKKVNGDVAMST